MCLLMPSTCNQWRNPALTSASQQGRSHHSLPPYTAEQSSLQPALPKARLWSLPLQLRLSRPARCRRWRLR